jgi:hypothetical protein
MEILLAKTPFMASMEEECFQMSASRSNLRARQEEIVTAEIVGIVTAEIGEIVTVNLVVIATVNHVVSAVVTVEDSRGEEEEDHLPEISASAAATRVIGKNFITNYKWMEKDEIEGLDFQRSERDYGGLSTTGLTTYEERRYRMTSRERLGSISSK